MINSNLLKQIPPSFTTKSNYIPPNNMDYINKTISYIQILHGTRDSQHPSALINGSAKPLNYPKTLSKFNHFFFAYSVIILVNFSKIHPGILEISPLTTIMTIYM